jgi:hypothetical protein
MEYLKGTKSEVTAQYYPDAQGNNSVNSNCNTITFYNTGTCQAYVNRIPLNAGTSISIEGDTLDTITTIFSITYTGSGTKQVCVIKKTYQG